MEAFIKVGSRGRFGNAVFRFLATRLFVILYNYKLTNTNNHNYYLDFDDISFISWYKLYILKCDIIFKMDSNLIFSGFYQHDTIYRLFKKEIIEYIITHSDDTIETDRNEIYYAKDILGPKPMIDFEYKTMIHLRIEDFIELGLAMDPLCIDSVLEKCEQPFLFVHKTIVNEYDQKYIDYFKTRFPSSKFYFEDVIQSYNLLRHAEVLVCSKSTISWLSALFNTVNKKVYMPRNYGTIEHETFQYPNDFTEIYEWKTISKEDIMKL